MFRGLTFLGHSVCGLNNTINLRPLKFTHYAVLYLQNGDRIVAIDSVTSLHLMYSKCSCSHWSPRTLVRILVYRPIVQLISVHVL